MRGIIALVRTMRAISAAREMYRRFSSGTLVTTVGRMTVLVWDVEIVQHGNELWGSERKGVIT
jgi:hypothetical protein